jgi:hypothetical protein
VVAPIGSSLLPFVSWTWVTGAKKDGGNYRVTLNSHFIEDHFCFLSTPLSQTAFGQKKHAK